MKTISSHRVRQHQWPQVRNALWGKHFWSPSYAVISCGGAPLEHVKQYIRGQQTGIEVLGLNTEFPIGQLARSFHFSEELITMLKEIQRCYGACRSQRLVAAVGSCP